MKTSLLDQALTFHHDLPGIIRATLNDYGFEDQIIDEALLGWDGRRVTRPVFDVDGCVFDIERYELAASGKLEHLARELRW